MLHFLGFKTSTRAGIENSCTRRTFCILVKGMSIKGVFVAIREGKIIRNHGVLHTKVFSIRQSTSKTLCMV